MVGEWSLFGGVVWNTKLCPFKIDPYSHYLICHFSGEDRIIIRHQNYL